VLTTASLADSWQSRWRERCLLARGFPDVQNSKRGWGWGQLSPSPRLQRCTAAGGMVFRPTV